jgi:hypothetical protein
MMQRRACSRCHSRRRTSWRSSQSRPSDACRSRSRRFPFSALVIGSMIPDFPLFVPFSPGYETTHSVPGVFTACLPIGLAGFFVFQLLMKRPLFALLPQAIQHRCVGLSRPSVEPTLKFFAYTSLAVVIGSLTHVCWDSFTHPGRWGTERFPWLEETALSIGGQALPWYKLLQYGSTLIGLPCLMLLLARWIRQQTPVSLDPTLVLPGRSKVMAYLVLILVPALTAVVVWGRGGSSPYQRLGQSITDSGSPCWS